MLLLTAWIALVLQTSMTREAAYMGAPVATLSEALGAVALALSAGFMLACIILFVRLARREVRASAKKVTKTWLISTAKNISGAALKGG